MVICLHLLSSNRCFIITPSQFIKLFSLKIAYLQLLFLLSNNKITIQAKLFWLLKSLRFNHFSVMKKLNRLFLHQCLIYRLYGCNFQAGHPPIYVTFSVRPSMSVVHHISGTVCHLIIMFGTHVENDDISRCSFHFYEILIFLGCQRVKGQKNSPQ